MWPTTKSLKQSLLHLTSVSFQNNINIDSHYDNIWQNRGTFVVGKQLQIVHKSTLNTVCSKYVLILTLVFHLCVSVDSLTCNKCSFGLVGLCLSTSEETCSTNTSVCFTGKASRFPPKAYKLTPFPFQTLHNHTDMILVQITPKY